MLWCRVPRHAANLVLITHHAANFGAITRHAKTLCHPLSFIDIQASFEKAYWRIEPLLEENDEELVSSTLSWIALNYIQWTSPSPPKALVKALNCLKKRNDIVITKPDIKKAREALWWTKLSIFAFWALLQLTTLPKLFTLMTCHRLVGDWPKHFHPLLQKEKELRTADCRL